MVEKQGRLGHSPNGSLQTGRQRPRKRAWTAQAEPASSCFSKTQMSALSSGHHSTKYSPLLRPGPAGPSWTCLTLPLGTVSHQIPWLPGTVGDALQYQLAQTGFSAQILDKVCDPLSIVGVSKMCHHQAIRDSWLIVTPWECLWRSHFRNRETTCYFSLSGPLR